MTFYYALIVFSLALTISIISYKMKLLTIGGSIVQFLLAIITLGLGKMKWALPIIIFFFLSSFLTKLRERKNTSVNLYFEKSGQRDSFQVLANGGIGGFLVMLFQIVHSELLYFVYVSSIAAVCADTWATEFGTMWKTKTINILNLKMEEQGVSGAISLNGFIGSFLGAFVIALSSLSWIYSNKITILLIIIISGLIGSLVDSILGASIQAQYNCAVCGKITEKKIHCMKIAARINGIPWINNDVVNFAASIVGGFFFYLISIFLKV